MKVVAHCFADNSSITPNKLDIKFKDFDVSLFCAGENLTLQISKILTDEELTKFSKSVITSTSIEDVEEQLDAKLRPYEIVLTEVSQLFEGLFGLLYHSFPPHFDTSKTFVNLHGETETEI